MSSVPPPKAGRGLDWLALCLTPWLVALQGHRFGVGNHDFLIAFLRRMMDPYYLAADFVMTTPPSHPQLLATILPLVRSWGENGAFLMLHLGTRLFLLMGVWRLVLALLPGRTGVAALAMLATFFEPRLRVGGHYLQGGHWEPGFLGMAAAVWTLGIAVRFVRNEAHWITLAMAAGFGFFAHLFIGGPVFIAVFLGIILAGRRDLETAQAFIATVALGSITWLPALTGFLQGRDAVISGQEVIQLLQFRHPHHHQPWTWPLFDLVQAAAVLTAGVFCWRRIVLRDDKAAWAIPATLLAWFAATCAVFTVLGLLQIVPLVAYLQPFRLFSLLLILALIGMIECVLRATSGAPWWGRIIAVIAMLVLLRFAAHGGVLVASVYTVVCAVWGGRGSAELPHLIPSRRWLALGGAVGCVLIGSLQRSETVRDFANSVRREHWLVETEPQEAERRELAAWIRTNTPGSALFAIPPAMDGFRLWERRSIVVDFKNIPYRANDMAEWAERYALAANVDPYIPFAAIPTEDAPPWQMVLLATTYGARYVVVREPLVDRTVVFRNERYSVIDLERATVIDVLGDPARLPRQ